MITEEEFRKNSQLMSEGIGYGMMDCWGRYLDLKGRKWQKAGEDCIMRGFTICTARQVLSA